MLLKLFLILSLTLFCNAYYAEKILLTLDIKNINAKSPPPPPEIHDLPEKYTNTVKNFYLFTRSFEHGKKYEELDPTKISSILKSHFRSAKTYIIVHGFLGWGLEDWIISLKDKLLEKEDCNVISVDWPSGSEWLLPFYTYAARRVPAVGADCAVLTRTLIEHKKLYKEYVHFIGHSLGAHVCGFTGKHFNGKLGRITGLDPAGPHFRKQKKTKRLDKSDAVFVDIIHTNGCVMSWTFSDCYGIEKNIGHIDFWPNGGKTQPGCKKDKELKGELGCNHEMAYKYYIESLDYKQSYYDINNTQFLARPCKSLDMYDSGNCSCGEYPQYMGFNVKSYPAGTYYLKTNKEKPYAMQDNNCHFPAHPAVIITSVVISVFILLILSAIIGWFIWKRAKANPELSPLLNESSHVSYT